MAASLSPYLDLSSSEKWELRSWGSGYSTYSTERAQHPVPYPLGAHYSDGLLMDIFSFNHILGCFRMKITSPQWESIIPP